ncbi:MAG: bifunctional DedA family/phosphatase PAP2 family protein [Candidatus Paceibacterota bacterium]|jgi:undecaprenyl-diphosphatase
MPFAHLFVSVVSNIETIISHGGYFLLFILSIIEGIPIIGLAVPGQIFIMMAGFFVKIGLLDFWTVIIVASIGAMIGDFIGYFIGRKYGMAFIDRIRPYFGITDLHLDKARKILDQHTGKAMIIGRFTPATRPILPFMVGASKTSAGKFWFFNIIGALLWVISSVLIGYIFGAGYHAISGYVGRLVLVAIIFVALIIWGYRFVNARIHIFRRYELFTLILCITSLISLVGIIDVLRETSFHLGFDVWVNLKMVALQTFWPPIVYIANIISTVGGVIVTGSLGIIIGLYFIFRQKWRSAVIMFLAIDLTGIALGLMKSFFDIDRPANALRIILGDPSFPSGHAAMAACFFVVFAYLFSPRINKQLWRELLTVIAALAIIVIGLSRLVLNVHFASDVLAGWALGVLMATVSILIVRYVSVFLIRKDKSGELTDSYNDLRNSTCSTYSLEN